MNRVGIVLVAIAFSLATTSSVVKANAPSHMTRLTSVTCPAFVGVNLNLATAPANVNQLPADASWEGYPAVVGVFDRLDANESSVGGLRAFTKSITSEQAHFCSKPTSASRAPVPRWLAPTP